MSYIQFITYFQQLGCNHSLETLIPYVFIKKILF